MHIINHKTKYTSKVTWVNSLQYNMVFIILYMYIGTFIQNLIDMYLLFCFMYVQSILLKYLLKNYNLKNNIRDTSTSYLSFDKTSKLYIYVIGYVIIIYCHRSCLFYLFVIIQYSLGSLSSTNILLYWPMVII